MKNFTNLFLQNHFFQGLILLFSFTFYSTQTYAQAPGITCLTAVAIGGTGNVPGCTGAATMSDFTVEGTTPSIAGCIGIGTFRREGWYSFTIGAPTAITVTGTATTASSNLLIQVISGTCAAEVVVLCINNTNAAGAQTETGSLGVLAAGTYFVRCVNVGAAANMAMSNLCVNVTPINDDCANPIGITPLAASAPCGGTAGNTLGATPQAAIPATCTGANTNNDDVWYTFTASSTSHVVTVTPTATMDPVFQVYSTNPCGGAGTSIACINAFGASTAETTTLTGLTIGATYWVRVYDAGTGIPSSSLFTICIQTPPTNDDCGGAIVLTANPSCITTAGDVNVASNSGIAGCTAGSPDEDVWYSFVATCTSQTITVTGSASFDPCYQVFSGACPGGLVSVLCNAPGGNTGLSITSSVSGLTIGSTYYVRVYDYGVGYPATTGFTICIVNAPPANDDCINAIALTAPSVVCNTTSGDVCGATQSLAGCLGNANDDIWYKFTASQASHIVTVTGNGTFDAVVQAFNSCGGASLGCVNATGAGGSESLTLSGLTIGQVYYVRVYDFGAGFPSTTTFTICVTSPPVNDNCLGTLVPVNGSAASPSGCVTSLAGTVAGASASAVANLCGGVASDDVWYNFNATATSHIITVTPCASFNPVIQVFSTACGGTSIGCANLTSAGVAETITLTGLSIGSTYWVRIYDFTGSSACATFTICVTTPPANNPCSGAITLTPGFTCVNTAGTVSGATPSQAATCGGTANDDVWYTFVAGAINQTITVTGSAGFDPVIEVFSTSCGGTSLGCTNASGIGGNESAVFTTLTAGQTYWVRVYDFNGSILNFNFSICITEPSNDLCANAYTAVCGGVYTGCTSVACGMTGTGDPTGLCVAQTAPAQGVWYVFAGTGQNVILTTCGGTTNYDTQLFVYSGTCGALTCVTGDDDMCNPACVGGVTCGYPQASHLQFGTVVGTNYYIFVSGWSGATGNFTLTVTCAAPPVNDQCNGAINLTCGTTITGSTLTASGLNDITGCGAANATSPIALWYYYLGDSTNLSLATCGGTTNFNTQIAVWKATSCAGPFTCVAGNDDFGGCNGSAAGNASTVTFLTTNYVSYYIEVFGFFTTVATGSQAGNFSLGISGAGAGGCSPLPIELLNFTGKSAGDKNLLQWQTASEHNNDYFTLERSDDAQTFMTITRINGAGNSSSMIAYQTYDYHPNAGITYYRLKQDDYNGVYTYSDIISVQNNNEQVGLYNLRPNPTTSDVSFDFYTTIKGKATIQIVDYMGKVVSEVTENAAIGTSVLSAKMNTLPKGIYFLKVSFDQSDYVSLSKVVKD